MVNKTNLITRSWTSGNEKSGIRSAFILVWKILALCCFMLFVSIGQTFADCASFGQPVPPKTLAEVGRFLLASPEPNTAITTTVELDDEGFAVPPAKLKFSTMDPASGQFGGQIVTSQNRTFPISGKMRSHGDGTFDISFSFTQTIGAIARPTDPRNFYSGAIRASVDAKSCDVPYHIAGTFTVKALRLLNSTHGPAPFSGKGRTNVVTLG